jgi:putative transcriptional regulator
MSCGSAIRGDDLSDSGPNQPGSGRLLEALLAAYEAGKLSEPFAVLVASHLQMQADNWAHAAPGPAAARGPRPPPTEADSMAALMPLALRAYVSRHLGAPEWRTLLPGIKQCLIARSGRGDARFLRCRPGAVIPAHTHERLEAVLVLQGGFRDADGHYAIGDIAVADPTVHHRLVADRGGECIIFVVLEGSVRLTGPVGRIIQRLFGA